MSQNAPDSTFLEVSRGSGIFIEVGYFRRGLGYPLVGCRRPICHRKVGECSMTDASSSGWRPNEAATDISIPVDKASRRVGLESDIHS